MNKLKKIEGNLNEIICDKQDHWDGENYVHIPKDALLNARAFVEIDSETDTPRTIMYQVYKNKKGYYVKIRCQRVYLKDIGFNEVKND